MLEDRLGHQRHDRSQGLTPADGQERPIDVAGTLTCALRLRHPIVARLLTGERPDHAQHQRIASGLRPACDAVRLRAAGHMEELWALFASGGIRPVATDSFPIEQYEVAFNCMIERRARGKVILTMS